VSAGCCGDGLHTTYSVTCWIPHSPVIHCGPWHSWPIPFGDCCSILLSWCSAFGIHLFLTGYCYSDAAFVTIPLHSYSMTSVPTTFPIELMQSACVSAFIPLLHCSDVTFDLFSGIPWCCLSPTTLPLTVIVLVFPGAIPHIWCFIHFICWYISGEKLVLFIYLLTPGYLFTTLLWWWYSYWATFGLFIYHFLRCHSCWYWHSSTLLFSFVIYSFIYFIVIIVTYGIPDTVLRWLLTYIPIVVVDDIHFTCVTMTPPRLTPFVFIDCCWLLHLLLFIISFLGYSCCWWAATPFVPIPTVRPVIYWSMECCWNIWYVPGVPTFIGGVSFCCYCVPDRPITSVQAYITFPHSFVPIVLFVLHISRCICCHIWPVRPFRTCIDTTQYSIIGISAALVHLFHGCMPLLLHCVWLRSTIDWLLWLLFSMGAIWCDLRTVTLRFVIVRGTISLLPFVPLPDITFHHCVVELPLIHYSLHVCWFPDYLSSVGPIYICLLEAVVVAGCLTVCCYSFHYILVLCLLFWPGWLVILWRCWVTWSECSLSILHPGHICGEFLLFPTLYSLCCSYSLEEVEPGCCGRRLLDCCCLGGPPLFRCGEPPRWRLCWCIGWRLEFTPCLIVPGVPRFICLLLLLLTTRLFEIPLCSVFVTFPEVFLHSQAEWYIDSHSVVVMILHCWLLTDHCCYSQWCSIHSVVFW